MKVHPKILEAQLAARRWVQAWQAFEAMEARFARELPPPPRGTGTLSRDKAKAMLVTAMDQEKTALNELLAALYDEAILDIVSNGSVE